MAKKRKLIKKIKPYIGYAIAVCALLAILSLLLTGVVLVPPTESMEKISISGFTAIFGWSTEIERMGIKVVTEYTTFSFMGLLVLVFSILGAVASLINNKTLNIISILLFVAGAIFVFLLKIDFVNAGTDALKLYINVSFCISHEVLLKFAVGPPTS